jgi:hypothetical protein
MNTERVTEAVDGFTRRWGSSALRWTAALLWLGNVSWKRPPGFSSLGGYTKDAVAHPVLPGAPWAFQHLISPHLWAFGWLTVVVEGGLAVLLMSGRYRRVAGVLGIVQSFAILSAVANTPGEWYWSYILMMALHVAVLVTAPQVKAPSGKAMAGATVGFGLFMAAAHSGEGLTGTAFTLFNSKGRNLPNDLGKNLFGGSVLLGLLIAVVGVLVLVLAPRLDAARQRLLGTVIAVIAVLSVFTYDASGLFIGLGSTTTTAAVVAALGLSFAIAADGGPRGEGGNDRAPVEAATVPVTA